MCGKMLLNGDGIPANKKEAFEYFKRAAQQGNKHAQYMCGEFFYSGEVVPQDKQKAFEYYNLCCLKGMVLKEAIIRLLTAYNRL
jgi:hypothetical protein